MALSQGVFDLKIAQLNQETITSFKDHKKESPKVHPRNEKDTYTSGDVITFDLKGQGVDYINMNNSALYLEIKPNNTTQGADDQDLNLLYGTCGLIARLQITNGSVDLMDINSNYGKFVYLEVLGNAGSENYKSKNVGIDGLWSSGLTNFQDDIDLQLECPSSIDANVYHNFRVPLITILDAGGYLPVYNLAEQLQIKITLEQGRQCVWGGTTLSANNYLITRPFMVLDGLTVLGGGKMNNTPYRFHAINAISYKNQISNESESLSYDIKKTSLKKTMGFFYNEETDFTMDYRVRRCFLGGSTVGNHRGNVNGALVAPLCTNFVFNLGGKNFPYEQPLDEQSQYIQVEKYFHKYDLTNGLDDDWMMGFFSGWGVGKCIHEPYRRAVVPAVDSLMTNIPFVNTILCCSFDRLDQTSEIISGIDSERFDIQLRFTGLSRIADQGIFAWFNPWGQGAPVVTEFEFEGSIYYNAIYWYDCIVTFSGGQINIKD